MSAFDSAWMILKQGDAGSGDEQYQGPAPGGPYGTVMQGKNVHARRIPCRTCGGRGYEDIPVE